MVLAEALQASIDNSLSQLEADDFYDLDHYQNTGFLLGTLLCNPTLFNQLGPEPDLLAKRFEAVYLRWEANGAPQPDSYFFDY